MDSSLRRASGLQFQFLCVEVFSFFPKYQRNSCDLACQCKACHGWLGAFGERGLIKRLQGARPRTRSSSHCFEQTLQIVVMVLIETADGNQFLGASQLSFHIAVFRTDASLQSQSAVSPQLALGAKTMGSLNQSHQQGSANWPYVGNLPELTGDLVLVTLPQQLPPCWLPQPLRHVQRFVEMFSTPANSAMRNLLQPQVAMAGIVDVSAAHGIAQLRYTLSDDSSLGSDLWWWSGSCAGLRR